MLRVPPLPTLSWTPDSVNPDASSPCQVQLMICCSNSSPVGSKVESPDQELRLAVDLQLENKIAEMDSGGFHVHRDDVTQVPGHTRSQQEYLTGIDMVAVTYPAVSTSALSQQYAQRKTQKHKNQSYPVSPDTQSRAARTGQPENREQDQAQQENHNQTQPDQRHSFPPSRPCRY